MKIVLLGDTKVGKTWLLHRLKHGVVPNDSSATIGAAYSSYCMQLPSGAVQMQIYDTAGQEKYRSLAPMYYRAADCAILVFDITEPSTFYSLRSWMMELSERGPSKIQVYVVGTKADLESKRKVSQQTASTFAKDNHARGYMETSALTGFGVLELFTEVARSFLENSDMKLDEGLSTPIQHEKENKKEKSCC